MRKLLLSVSIILLASNAYSQINYADSNDVSIVPNALNFIAMGDFGRNGEYMQKEVATQMGITAKKFEADFFVITGDNFYPSGVASTQDYSWIASFENIYTAHALQNPWYVVLGNHDYKGNLQAEIDYTKISRRWYMPSKYFTHQFYINDDTTQKVLIIFLDTTPFITQYYSSDDHRANVVKQDTTAQKKWLVKVLANRSPNIKWTFIAGHHPLYTGGKRINAADTYQMYNSFKSIFDKYKVDAYICGHEHSLQYIKPAGPTHYFITGAGSETTPAILYPQIGKFARSINGFMCFSVTPSSMFLQVVSVHGKVLYKEAINK